MAYVGTFALHDAAGAVLVSRRFAATAAEGPDDVTVRVFAEVAHARATRPTLPLAIFVQDGAPELWNLMTAACARHGITPTVERIHWYHLDAHIAALLDLVAATDGCAETRRRRWAAALDRRRPSQPCATTRWRGTRARPRTSRRTCGGTSAAANPASCRGTSSTSTTTGDGCATRAPAGGLSDRQPA